MRRRGSENGYTLSELLVVLVILGLMASIGPTALRKLVPSMAVRASSETLIADLESLRSQAMLAGQSGAMALNETGTGYNLSLGAVPVKTRAFERGVSLEVGNNFNQNELDQAIVLVRPDGVLRGADMTLIRGNRRKTVWINPVFGAAQIKPKGVDHAG